MAIKIHHGPNGSYKTSGAIQDDLIPALKQGRYIITNIRGLTRERVFQVFPETPSTLEVVNLDLEDLDDIEKMRTFPQWAPRGAFIIFDEAQLLFLKSWREADLRKFDFPGGPAAAKEADRPMNWLDGWTRHRHWNWDIILTTPNIGYIRDDIRLTSEKAYLHSNLAVIGIKGRYKESQHAGTENKPPANGTIVEIKKIKQETFRLYDSTATGTVTDTIAGKSIFKQPKVLFFLALPPICIWAAFNAGGFGILTGQGLSPPVESSGGTSVSARMADPEVHPDPAGRVAAIPDSRFQAVGPDFLEHPFQHHQIVIKASLYSRRHSVRQYIFAVRDSSGREFQITDKQLLGAGYRIDMASDCAVRLVHGEWSGYAVCSPGAGRAAERLVSERSGAAGTGSDVPVARH